MKKTYNYIHKFNKLKILRIIIPIWLIYAFITGVLLLAKPRPISENYKAQSQKTDYFSDVTGPDRGIIIDNPLDAGLARLKVISSAEEKLDISYFSIETGESPNLFFAALIDAADRGVEVNLLLDGMFHGLKGEFRSIIYTFILHPNMNLKFYEPFNPFKPWTLNNRMHDKYIIADDSIAIIGGRNIGDKYFAPDWYNKNITNDRDVILINTKPEDKESVLHQMSTYFDKIWNHKYSQSIDKHLGKIRNKKAMKKSDALKEKLRLAREEYREILEIPIDLMEISFPTNKISFIHNPIERFSKEPWCWYELTQLMKSAKRSIFIQSPYVIPSKGMIEGYINKEDVNDINISLLTNSMASTPNLPAFSGYLNHRKSLVDNDINVFEYQSKDSLHTKAYVIDDDLLAIGSFNLDARSAYLSTESMVVIHSAEAVEKLEMGLMDYIDSSLLVTQNYDYLAKDGVEEAYTSPFKRGILKLLSYAIRWFEYLL